MTTMTTATIARTVHHTRLGDLAIEASGIGLVRVAFSGSDARSDTGSDTAPIDSGAASTHVADATRQIDEYLAGARRDFTVPVDWTGMSAFDAGVLQALRATAGYGETTSYGDVAHGIGRGPTDARKVGGALARNRVLIIVPCHRVLAADGALTGYAGGLAIKRALLDLESSDWRLALDGM
jgi:methylated-DNA-[protein]-cysteine S-methyltransferase